ncbi:hypothetical protein EJ03DRAFT_152248 [Teratosphaeria nubilosa]|uniref:Uncharacterized protein n=1 Tax=Teratosphaeria nubilosa TaxID=161662 RepID=A0A6G1LJC3_9PEZI|nr:hypothetical protein EJ03DRAFT_152248 [Teratosphaeria nubilosa]
MSRSPSIASDRHSVVSGMTPTCFANATADVHPRPAYIAPSGATQVVAEHRALTQKHASDDEDSRPNRDECKFSPKALGMINAFLDQLLFSFLYTARSTRLKSLRPAVKEILKSKLGRDAVASVEEELKELTAGGDEEEDINTAEHHRRWDLELVWKRTRLRVMVYMRLGEMEDEDEERYVKEEHLAHGSDSATRRFSHSQSGLVSWAAAIFLTGVLEHIAEKMLQVAGNAAYSRTERQTQPTNAERRGESSIVVEEYDVEKVALNSGIGRLWRSWRKTMRETSPVNRRQPTTPNRCASLGRELTNAYYAALAHHRRGSSGGVWNEGVSVYGEDERPMPLEDVPEMEFPEHVLASNIPLPIDDHDKDVSEIEVPGLARDPDEAIVAPVHLRRNSLTGGLPTPDKSPVEQHSSYQKPPLSHKRPTSMPSPAATPLSTAVADAFAADIGPCRQDLAGEARPDRHDVVDASRNPESEMTFSAREMAAHKRISLDTNTLIGMSDGAPAKASDLPSDENRHHELDGGAIVDVSAKAGATVATGGRRIAKEQDVSVPSQDVDQRKSLVSLKDIIVAASSDAGAHRDSQRSKVRTSSPSAWGRREHEDSCRNSAGSTGALSILPSARRQVPSNLQADDIGIARTSDVVVPSPRSWTPPDQQARDGVKRPARLVLDDTMPHGSDCSSDSDSSSASPRTLRRDVAPTRHDVAPVQADPAVRPISTRSKAEKRRSIPGVALSSAAIPTAARYSYRQSWRQRQKEEHDRPSRPVSITPGAHSTAGVQEHPVLQRLASLKHKHRKSDSPVSVDISEPVALTSGSIRGPEDFDMLVQGADTVKYTLTPEAVRDWPVSSLPRRHTSPGLHLVLHVAQELMRQVQPADPANAPAFPRKPRASVPPPIDTRITRGRQPAPPGNPKQATATPEESLSAKRTRAHRRSTSKPSARNLSAHSRSGLMAREPRVQTESTRDFADFIRSTGPSKEEDVRPFIDPAGRSTTSLQSLRSAHVHGASRAPSIASPQRSTRQDRSKSITSSDLAAGRAPPVPTMPTKVKKTMKARGATIHGNTSSDLIDFIRSGPDQAGEHRISRSVAPFRSTMDSDQLKEIGDRINGDQPLDLRLNTDFSSTAESSVRASSTTARTSANSRSALLGSNADAVVHPAHSGQQQRLGSKLPVAGTIPERKRHRNKDPYAIDFDDDNDLDSLTALPKNKRQEESLMDFLNSNEPPQDNGPKPVMNGTTETYISKPRANSIRRSSVASSGSPLQSNAPRVKSTQAPPAGPRAGASSGRTRQNSIQSPNRPKMEARDSGTPSRTSDLADFFKNSAPPGQKFLVDPHSAAAPSVGRHSKLNAKNSEKENKKIAKHSIVAEGEPKSKKGLFSRFSVVKGKAWIEAP